MDRVELAGAGTVAELGRRVADALRLLVDTDDEEALLAALQLRGPCLLILEQAVEQAVEVAREVLPRWLTAAPRLTVLATSRVLLGIPDEHALDLAPLAIDPAERLFLRHLGAGSHHGWTGDLAEKAARDVVRQFGGHLLAIVLAASWAAQLGPQALGRRLASGTVPTAATKHEHRFESLRGALDHSWGLLDEDARGAFAALAIFEGPFERDDAAAMLAPPADGTTVDRLVAHSLLATTDDEPPLHAMHPPLREYAARRLAGSPAREAVQRRHATWLRDRAEQWRADLEGPHAAAVLDAIERSRADLRAAIRRSWKKDPSGAARLGGALASLARWRGTQGPGPSTAARSVDLARSSGEPAALAAAMIELAWARIRSGTLKDAATLLHDARRSAQRGRAPRLITRADAATMHCANLLGSKPDAIRRLGRDALERTARDGDTWGEAEILRQWGYCELRSGRYTAALRMRRAGLDLVRDHGHVLLEPAQRLSLAAVLDAIDRTDAARNHRHLALSQAHQLGLLGYEANAFMQLATAELNRYELDRARGHVDSLMELVRRHATVSHLGGALHALGLLELLEGRTERGRKALKSAAERLREGGHRWETASVMHSLALADHLDGWVDAARTGYLEALKLLGDGYAAIASELRLELGMLEARAGRARAARQLVEAAASQASAHESRSQALACGRMAAAMAGGSGAAMEAGALVRAIEADEQSTLQDRIAAMLLRRLIEVL